jgi:predicted amidohydrolase
MFDLGRSTRRHFSAEVARQAITSGFEPDFLSSDLVSHEWTGTRDHELHAILAEFVELGMSVPNVLSAATERPARFYGLPLPAPSATDYVEFDDRLRLQTVTRGGSRLFPSPVEPGR